jgi:hypothetical protein
VTTRERDIVKAASTEVRNKLAKAWLRDDERGFWERQARDYIERSNEKALELGLTPERQDAAIAVQIAFLAVSAILRGEKPSCDL